MKSINQIIGLDNELRDRPEIQELIEYCRELEGQVIELKQNESFSFEDKLASVIRDIYSSIKDLEREEMEHVRFGYDKPDYESIVGNLGDYLREFSKDNGFKL